MSDPNKPIMVNENSQSISVESTDDDKITLVIARDNVLTKFTFDDLVDVETFTSNLRYVARVKRLFNYIPPPLPYPNKG